MRSSWASGRWNAVRYADARLTRLLVPLIPALLLTAFWDRLGQGLFGSVAPYLGWLTGPAGEARQGLNAFVGNLVFLQDVLVPTFGSNGPLWSLSREFWYYVVFPLLFLGLRRDVSLGKRAGLLVAAVLTMLFARYEIVVLFPVWLFGVGVAFLPRGAWAAKTPFRSLTVVALLASMSLFRIAPHLPSRAGDYVVGFAFAAFVYSVLCGAPREPSKLYERFAGFGADISYTLYLVHVPFLAFLAASYLRNHEPLPLSPLNFLVVIGLCLVTMAYAIGLWWLFERNTRRIRTWLVRLTAPKAPE